MSEESIVREAIDKAHKRNRFWAILFPVLLISLVVVGVVIWIAIKGGVGAADTENLAGVATILLVLPTFLFGLITLALIIGMIIGVIKLHEFLPQGGKAIRSYLSLGQHYLRVAQDASAEPFLALRGFNAKIQQIGTSLTDRFSQKG
ncbi:MAG TPA: hypothetical protein PLH64_09400 [Anaerolineaceae bacterium]|nr:hypothetical protein [Anaerolineaceae bacterium]